MTNKYTYEVYGKNVNDKTWQFIDYPDTFLKFIICIFKRRKFDYVHAHKKPKIIKL